MGNNNKQIKLGTGGKGNESTTKTMIYFPDELVEEILSHLPVQILIRFKTVSKSWNNIISSPSFAKSHLNNYGKNNFFALLAFDVTTEKWKLSLATFGTSSESTTVVVGGRRAEEKFIELPILKLKKYEIRPRKGKIITAKDRVITVGPFNGFICIHGIQRIQDIILYNSYNRTSEILPSGGPISDGDGIRFGSKRSMGFGLDFITKEIKLVQLLSFYFWVDRGFVSGIRVDIYSPSTKTWRQLDRDVATTQILVENAIGSYKDGSFAHWLECRQTDIISFDMKKEVFVTTPLPIRIHNSGKNIKIFVKESRSLVLFLYPDVQVSEENYLFDRWELTGLGEQGKHWSLLTRIGPFLGVCKPVGALWSSHVIVVRVGDNKLVFYDYSTQQVRITYHLEDNNYYNFIKVLDYKGTPYWSCITSCSEDRCSLP
ncbi:PREDICTED: putative F-box protein At1g33530 [Erythranthe guttata]|uniref:putative F-box protein At1g33530 n=1 Tax=Erythranthe guttata TaxID=4155 RepID=UPI00064DD68F|nr:PREDICTED: putative F-box protein At1g33530 [Erythranthe guttata]|eukprot:XP_012850988.1 PREDICTED: putative F-box protein At1g33530 [Erythranthe guttata]